MESQLGLLKRLAQLKYEISDTEVRLMIKAMSNVFRQLLSRDGFEDRAIRSVVTKFRDAGRRSAPWKPVSGRVPGRPQDGADGNRRNRWLFDPIHKFYATEVNATLVEMKYYLQTLSMSGAPHLPPDSIQDDFLWLTGHRIEPGVYKDPIQLAPIEIRVFLEEPRSVQSGHLVPLDRGGRHIPDNTFLMLYKQLGKSNAVF